MQKKIGIWIDKRIAKIVTFFRKKESFQIINSEIEEYNVKGGSGTRLKGGPQDVVHDSKYLEKENHHYKKYFNEIYDCIKDADSVVIIGPAQTGEKLRNELVNSSSKLNGKTIDLKKADKMTNNEIKIWVKKYYGQ